MSETPVVDSDVLRDQVREKYRAVAVDPNDDVPLPHRPAARRPARLRPGDRRRAARPRCRVVRRGRQPVLAAHDRTRRTCRRRRFRRRVRLLRRRPPRRARRRRRRRRHDPRDAHQVHATPPHCSASPTSSSATGSPRHSRSTTAGPTSSSPTASSTSAPTSAPCSTRSTACCARAACCSSPTSPTADPCRSRRCATSICGPVELPAGCPVRAGIRCSPRSASSTSRSDPPVDTFGGATRRSQRPHVRGLRLRLPRPKDRLTR